MAFVERSGPPAGWPRSSFAPLGCAIIGIMWADFCVKRAGVGNSRSSGLANGMKRPSSSGQKNAGRP